MTLRFERTAFFITAIFSIYLLVGASDFVRANEQSTACPTFPATIAAGDSAALVEAITCANTNGVGTNDVINLASGIYTLTAVNNTGTQGANGLPQITDGSVAGTLTINGNGAVITRSTVSGTPAFRFFELISGANLTLNNLTLSNGGNVSRGGAIYASGAELTFNKCTISGNAASNGSGIYITETGSSLEIDSSTISSNKASGSGGGIYAHRVRSIIIFKSTISNNEANAATGIGNTRIGGAGIYVSDNGQTSSTNIVNSTISGNKAAFHGGGIFVYNNSISSTVSLFNSTIAFNQSDRFQEGGEGGGIRSEQGLVGLGSTIIIGNTDGISSNAATSNCSQVSSGSISVGQTNLTQANTGCTTSASTMFAASAGVVLSSSLANNGGFTATHRLLANSPAINTGSANGNTTDQRGAVRNSGVGVDIGAFEVAPFVTNSPAGTTLNNALSDSGDGSLRQEIADASSGDTIYFDPAFFDQSRTINLTSGELAISKNLTIGGTSARNVTVRRAAGNPSDFRIFSVGNFTVNISGIVVSGGNAVDGNGGGVLNNGTLTLDRVTISGNAATFGGGIYNFGGTTTLTNSTVTGNTASDGGEGGGILNYSGTTTLTNSTVSGNTAEGKGGGILNFSTLNLTSVTVTLNKSTSTNCAACAGGVNSAFGPANLKNTIVAGNTTGNASASPDFYGAVASGSSYNLIGNGQGMTGIANGDANSNQVGVDPLLELTLKPNGGTTATHTLLAGSPAIDKGNSFGLNSDQRGFTRPVDNPSITNANNGDGADIGAFEVASVASTLSISGVVSYGTAPTGQPKVVAGVMMLLTGSSSTSTDSDTSGAYLLDNLTSGGNYTVTPSKTGNRNGITAFDATLVLRCVAAGNSCALTANQKIAADTDGDANVTAFDATQILRFVAANGQNQNTGQTGNWKFVDSMKTYNPLSASQSIQDYTAFLIGEIDGDWTP